MKRASIFKRLLSVILVVSMIAAMAVPALADENVNIKVTQVDNSSVSATIPGRESADRLNNGTDYSDKDVVRVSIFLDKAGTIDAGYSVNGLAENNSAMNYREGLKREQESLIQKIEAVIGSELDVVWNLTLAANLISANVMYGQIELIEQIPGVRSVVIETQYAPDVASSGGVDPNMATSGEQTGSTAAWAAGYTGAGTRIAIIDTGLDLEHEAFDAGAFDYSLAQLAAQKDMTTEEYVASLDLMDADEIAGILEHLNVSERVAVNAEDLYFSTKVPFGFNYVDENLDLSHYNSEHGSHVAGISAANSYVPAGDSYEPALATTYVQGVAPDAQLLVMKVFGTNGGAYDSDYMAAIEDAVLLGADAVNLSLGSGAPGMGRTFNAEYEAILDGLEGSGVTVVISAGNSGGYMDAPENGIPYLYLDDVSMHTGGSPGTYTNSLGVASVDNAGYTALYMTVGNTNMTYAETSGYGNEPFVTVAGTQEYVMVNGIGTAEDFAAVGDALEGKIALCYRGTTSFFEKANAAVEAGAAGVIIVNNQAGVIYLNLTGYNYTAPVASITYANGEAFKENGTAVTDGDGNVLYWTGSMEISAEIGVGSYNNDYYTMSSFSSWGIPGTLEMKPEITAPGGDIYSVAGEVPGYITGHDNYELMSGTSMAAPQVAGMVALMAQYIREEGLDTETGLDARTLAQSLLMSTAEPIMDGNNGGYYYPVLQQGAGLANVGNATTADSYILMLENATDSYADGKVKAELGDDPNKTGIYTFSFTINNLDGIEKVYALSADIFTQSAFSAYGALYMDTWTTSLAPTITWAVNGKTVSTGEELDGMDFNGDGYVNADDGQALLDYATGVRTELTNMDLADLNEDSLVNSYDSYLFFVLLNNSGVTVPADGSATVTVTIDLSTADEEWLAYYENGAYIEGFVYAQSLATAEGVEGTEHSIPVLGFYGNWSDASMYDKGSMMEYVYGLEDRAPYLYESVLSYGYANGLLITYHDDPESEYMFGGNPMVQDAVYMPERNAISGVNGDTISMLGFTTIRNAAAANFQVWNSQTGEYYIDQDVTGGTGLYSAYYYVNGGYWTNTYWQLNTNFQPTDIPDGTRIEVGITAALEYYMDDEGNVDWDALGDGATFSMAMTVDNYAPELKDVSISMVNNTLNVEVSDNQYIAAVALFDIYGQYLYTYQGSKADQAAGDTVQYALDLSEVNGPSFLLQVYDYANNVVTYKIETQIGEVVDTVSSIELSKTSTVMQLNNTETLTAIVYPVNASDRGVTWSSTNESVVTVDQNGTMTAVGVGTAVVTATSNLDPTVSASCNVEVININVDLNGIVWDEEGSIWFSEFNTTTLPEYVKLSGDMLDTDYFVAATVGPDNVLYASTLNTSNGTGALYTINTETYEATKLADCMVQGLHIFYSDLTYAPAMFGTGVLLGTYGPFVIAIDPSTGEALGILDQYDSDLVGITTCYGIVDTEGGQTQDAVYLIQNDGTVIQEVYVYLADYGVLPYFYYMYDERAAMDSGVDVGDAWYFNSVYYDGDYLYWSAHETDVADDVTLYAIDADYSGNVYEMGKFAPTVWPVGGLHELGVTPTLDVYSVATEEMENLNVYIAENGAPELPQYVLEARQVNAGTPGGVNSAAGYQPAEQPLSDTETDKNEGTVTVTVTAKDATGTDVASTNGVSTVTYDAENLTLVSIKVEGDYVSVKKSDGSVTFGYVELDGFAAGDTVATLVFEAKSTDKDTITVDHEEVSDETPGYEEELIYGCDHENTELVDDEEASCTKEGYTGDTVCTDCGHVVEEGEPIPMDDHDYESVVTPPTVEAGGYTTHTCKVCGDSYVDSFTPALDPDNPDTGDRFNPALLITVMLLSLAGASCLVIVGKKQKSF